MVLNDVAAFFKAYLHWQNLKKVTQGLLTEGERFITVDLLKKVACFVVMVTNIFNVKSS
jgi:hypothetical protein